MIGALLLAMAIDSTPVESAFMRDPCDCVRGVKRDSIVSIEQFYPSRKTAQITADNRLRESPVWQYQYGAVATSTGWKFQCGKRKYEVVIDYRGRLTGPDEGGYVVLKFYRLK